MNVFFFLFFFSPYIFRRIRNNLSNNLRFSICLLHQLEDNENDDCNNSVNLPLGENADNYNIYTHVANNNHRDNGHSRDVTKANSEFLFLFTFLASVMSSYGEYASKTILL